MGVAETARLIASLTLDDKGFSKGIDRAIAKSGNLEKTLGRVGQKGAAGLTATSQNVQRAVAGLGAAGVAGIAASVKVAADFEAQLRTINTVAGLTDTELTKVGTDLRGLAVGTGTNLDDLTASFYDLVSAGVDSADAMDVLTNANTLAIGGLGTTSETVDLLTTAINSYGLDASKAAEVTDMFAQSIAAGKVTASELAASFATVGPIASAAGIGIDELAAGYAQLTANGVPAAEASTQMRAAIVALQSPSAKLTKLQKTLGVNFEKLAKEKGLAVALDRLRKEADKAGIPLQDLLGRVEAVSFTLQTTGENLDDYTANLAAVNDANGTAAKQMAERQKGLNAQLSKLGATARDVGITIGTALLPQLTKIAEKVVGLVTDHQSDIQRFADQLPAAFDKALAFADRIPWETIGTGLQTAATWAGKLMDVFLTLPPEVQTTLIALAGLNKLSGGAVSGVVSELAKGLIKGVLGINAGVVHINAASVTGPGVGGPGGAGGGPGGLVGIAKNLLRMGIGVGIGLAGGQIVQAGAQQGGSTGTATALLGAGAMIGGGALAFGPIGAIAASLAAVVTTQQTVASGLTQMSQSNTATLEKMLANQPDRAALEQALAGVDEGIRQIESNPLNVLVAGDALAELKAQRATLQEKLSALPPLAMQQNITNERLEAIRGYTDAQSQSVSQLLASSERSESIAMTNAAKTQQQLAAGDTRTELALGQVGAKVTTSGGFISTAVNAAKSAIDAVKSATSSAGQQTAFAIRDKDLSVSVTNNNTVTTTVSVRDTITGRTRYSNLYRVAS